MRQMTRCGGSRLADDFPRGAHGEASSNGMVHHTGCGMRVNYEINWNVYPIFFRIDTRLLIRNWVIGGDDINLRNKSLGI